MSSGSQLKRNPYLFYSYIFIVFCVWCYFVSQNNLFYLIEKHFYAVITMIFGSFIAGSSPEGSASIAYPVFTLLLKIKPDDARNFAFAIQSIGMTSATIYLLNKHIKVEWNYIKYVTLGGFVGLLFGTFFVLDFITPSVAKLFFVSLWLSFGMVLWYVNNNQRKVNSVIPNFQKADILKLLIFGFIGGIISSIFGTGINIFTFCLLTIYYNIDEKVAVPSSIIIMTLETILGFFLHNTIIKDFSQLSFEMWIACIPFVVVFAPLGSYFISKISRISIARILYIILIIQFFGAIWVIKPNLFQISICLLTLVLGNGMFFYLSLNPRKGSS